MKQSVKLIVAAGIGGIVGFVVARALNKANQAEVETIEPEELEQVIATKPQQEKKVSMKSEPKQEPVKETPELIKDDGFPLELGSRGRRVERLQVFLMRKLGGIEPPSGVFDQATAVKVKRFFKTDALDQKTYEDLQLDKMLHDQRKKRA